MLSSEVWADLGGVTRLPVSNSSIVLSIKIFFFFFCFALYPNLHLECIFASLGAAAVEFFLKTVVFSLIVN